MIFHQKFDMPKDEQLVNCMLDARFEWSLRCNDDFSHHETRLTSTIIAPNAHRLCMHILERFPAAGLALHFRYGHCALYTRPASLIREAPNFLRMRRSFSAERYICFYAFMFGAETHVTIKMDDVIKLSKEYTYKTLPDAVVVTTRNGVTVCGARGLLAAFPFPTLRSNISWFTAMRSAIYQQTDAVFFPLPPCRVLHRQAMMRLSNSLGHLAVPFLQPSAPQRDLHVDATAGAQSHAAPFGL